MKIPVTLAVAEAVRFGGAGSVQNDIEFFSSMGHLEKLTKTLMHNETDGMKNLIARKAILQYLKAFGRLCTPKRLTESTAFTSQPNIPDLSPTEGVLPPTEVFPREE